MKHELGARTDTELATALGRTQGAVSHWRRKGSIPESVELDYQARIGRGRWDGASRAMGAVTIALKMLAILLSRARARGVEQPEWFYYSTVQVAFESLVQAVDKFLGFEALASRQPGWELALALFDDETFLASVADWLEQADFTDALGGVIIEPRHSFDRARGLQ